MTKTATRGGHGSPLFGAPGLPEDADGAELHVTDGPDGRNVREIRWRHRRGWPWSFTHPHAKERRMNRNDRPGMRQIVQAAWLLAVLDLGLLVVSFAGQYMWMVAARHQVAASVIEALCVVDLPMIVLSLLGFGLARSGLKTGYVNTLIVAFAAGSALMGFAAADPASWRSILAFTAPSVALAVLAHVTFNTVRRHVLRQEGTKEEETGWARLGRSLLAVGHRVYVIGLYAIRCSPPDWRARIKAAAPTLRELGQRDGIIGQLADAHATVTVMSGRLAEQRRAQQAELDQQAMRHAEDLEAALRDQALELETRHARALADERARAAERLASLVNAGPNGHRVNGHGGDPVIAALLATIPRDGRTIKDWLAALYRAHPDAWDRAKASKIAVQLGAATQSSEGTARNHIRALVAEHYSLAAQS